MNRKNSIFIYLLAILPMIFWGYSFIWYKVAFTYFKPISVVFMRLLVSSVLLLIFIKARGKKLKLDKEDIKSLAILSFFEPFCYFMGESFGLTYVSATAGSIIIATIPLVTPVFSHYYLKERTNAYQIAGLITSFVGVIFIVSGNFEGTTTIKGVLLLIFAVFASVGYGINLKKLAHRHSSMTIVFYQNCFALIYFFPFLIIWEGSHLLNARPDFAATFAIFKLALFGSTLAFVLITQVIRRIGLNNTNLFTNLIPVVTAIVAYFQLGEKFPFPKIVGIIIVLAGLFISQSHNLNFKFRPVRR